MARAFVHRLQQPLQGFGKSLVALRAAEPAGFLEISLCKAASRTLDFNAARRLLDLLGSAQAQ